MTQISHTLTGQHSRVFVTLCFCVLVAILLAAPLCVAQQLLVVLEPTGQERDGLPVLRPHPKPQAAAEMLSRGFSGRLLRIYRYQQQYLHNRSGVAVEPAYLLLSKKSGGFPRTGFYLENQAKPQTGFVDLHERSRLSGEFGTMDQIFPHELAHLIVSQSAGPPGHGGSNQLHSIGLRTDPMEAFSEGFAEHCQVLAIDDPDAHPATRALANDQSWHRYASGSLALYSKEMTARGLKPARWRLTFFGWFNQTEQILRYEAVRRNAYAREPDLPEQLYATADPYAAYLLLSVLPGSAGGRPKDAARMLATEGVVSYLFYRWSQSAELQKSYREDAFYAQFGADRAQVSPLENVYLKLIHAMAQEKPHNTRELIAGYKKTFPDEAAAVDRIVDEALLGQPLPAYPEIWLANPNFKTGSSLFDQFRAQPRMHTFDLNAAALVDLLGVPGVERKTAEAIVQGGPYAALEDLRRVPAVTAALLERFQAMAAGMRRLSALSDEEQGMNPARILWSYAWRFLVLVFAAALAGAVVFRTIRQTRPLRAGAAALGATLLALAGGWPIGGWAWTALIGVAVFGAVPAAAWAAWRKRTFGDAAVMFLAWVGAAIPAALLSWPW